MRSHLNIQVCVYPFFDGGFYVNFNLAMLMFRVSIGFIDLRLWYDRIERQPAFKSNPAPAAAPIFVYSVSRWRGPDQQQIELAENSDGSLKVFESQEKAIAAAEAMGEEWGYGVLQLTPAALATERTEPCIGAQQKRECV